MKLTVATKTTNDSFKTFKLRTLADNHLELERMLDEAYQLGREDAIQSDDLIQLLREVKRKIDRAQDLLAETVSTVDPIAVSRTQRDRIIAAIECLKQDETRFSNDPDCVSANYAKTYNAAIKDALSVVHMIYMNDSTFASTVPTSSSEVVNEVGEGI